MGKPVSQSMVNMPLPAERAFDHRLPGLGHERRHVGMKPRRITRDNFAAPRSFCRLALARGRAYWAGKSFGPLGVPEADGATLAFRSQHLLQMRSVRSLRSVLTNIAGARERFPMANTPKNTHVGVARLAGTLRTLRRLRISADNVDPKKSSPTLGGLIVGNCLYGAFSVNEIHCADFYNAQSRPKPRGGSTAASSDRSRSQITRNASAVVLSARFSGRVSSHA